MSELHKTLERIAEAMRTGAAFTVMEVTDAHVILRDDNVNGCRSVTNAADEVVAHIHRHYPGRRIFYYDSEGRLDELAHEDGRFVGFRPGGPTSAADELRKTLEHARLWRVPVDAAPIPAGHDWPDLATFQGFVGGYIELVPLAIEGVPVFLIVNEDGARTLPVNPDATRIYIAGRGRKPPMGPFMSSPADCIFGNAWLWIGELPEDA